jgi:glycosyltransferase involved in cell wall biosynthesis
MAITKTNTLDCVLICPRKLKGEPFDGGDTKIQSIEKILSLIGQSYFFSSTFYWKKHPYSTFRDVCKAIPKARNIFVITSLNGIRVLLPLADRKRKRGQKLFFFMIGVGPFNVFWKKQKNCASFFDYVRDEKHWEVKTNTVYAKALRKADVVAVETPTLKRMCEKILGLSNVIVVTNFREPSNFVLKASPHSGLRLLFFSRILKEKGAYEAAAAVSCLRKEGLDVTLDFYGPVYDEWGKEFVSNLSNGITYQGVFSGGFQEKYCLFSKYDCSLLPTRLTEGVPGAIVESFMSGVPVICSSFALTLDIIKDGINGVLFSGGVSELTSAIKKVALDKALLDKLKAGAIDSSRTYDEKNAVDLFREFLIP